LSTSPVGSTSGVSARQERLRKERYAINPYVEARIEKSGKNRSNSRNLTLTRYTACKITPHCSPHLPRNSSARIRRSTCTIRFNVSRALSFCVITASVNDAEGAQSPGNSLDTRSVNGETVSILTCGKENRDGSIYEAYVENR